MLRTSAIKTDDTIIRKQAFQYAWGGRRRTELPRQRWDAKSLTVTMSQAPERRSGYYHAFHTAYLLHLTVEMNDPRTYTYMGPVHPWYGTSSDYDVGIKHRRVALPTVKSGRTRLALNYKQWVYMMTMRSWYSLLSWTRLW